MVMCLTIFLVNEMHIIGGHQLDMVLVSHLNKPWIYLILLYDTFRIIKRIL